MRARRRPTGIVDSIEGITISRYALTLTLSRATGDGTFETPSSNQPWCQPRFYHPQPAGHPHIFPCHPVSSYCHPRAALFVILEPPLTVILERSEGSPAPHSQPAFSRFVVPYPDAVPTVGLTLPRRAGVTTSPRTRYGAGTHGGARRWARPTSTTTNRQAPPHFHHLVRPSQGHSDS